MKRIPKACRRACCDTPIGNPHAFDCQNGAKISTDPAIRQQINPEHQSVVTEALPELFELLRELTEHGVREGVALAEWIEDVRAALAKAEGRPK